ncbi:MAG: adenylosuccinate synthetase [Caldilineaceae bacterium]|nr:adenylosuccinate synthetase [Caldilineaceae bacterium]
MQQAFLTVDLGFGDAGKGSIVDYLTRAHGAHTVIRYNGGAQAGHRVVTPGDPPQEHVFAQFGAGTLAGAATHLSRFMLLDPLAMVEEEKHLRSLGVPDAFGHTTIDSRALVITPFQRAVNRLKELARGAGRHGSCGMGIGETMADALAHGGAVLCAGDLADPDRLLAKLRFLRGVNQAKAATLRARLANVPQAAGELDMLDDSEWLDWLLEVYGSFAARAQIVPAGELAAILHRPGTVVFEGAQGVLLDEWAGFHPYTTWSTTTLANADRLLSETGYGGGVTRLGITRGYATRHGAGPFVTEDRMLAAALPDARNTAGPWQQQFRVGWLDLVMLRYAREVVGPLDGLAVTCMDRLATLPSLQICQHYRCNGMAHSRITPVPTRQDLAYQARLTRDLERCTPVLQPVADANTLLAIVARELQTPVTLVSEGPTAKDKRERQPLIQTP